MVILGIDPGTTRAGFGVIKTKSGLEYIACGVLGSENGNHNERLVKIRTTLVSLLKKYKPERVVIETLFFAKNKKTALLVAEARGVIIETITEQNIPIIEITPNQIKIAVAGNGTATKTDIKKMMSFLLKTNFEKTIDDAVDALAAAFAGSGRMETRS